MTLEEVLPILKSGTPIARQPWLDDQPRTTSFNVKVLIILL